MVGKECKCEIHHRIKIQEAIMITKCTIMLIWKAWTRENKTRTHHDRKMADYVIIERLNTWSQYKKSSWSQHGQIYHNKKSLNTWSQYKTWSSSHNGRLCHYQKHEHVITIQEVTMITKWPIMSLWEVWTRDHNTRIDSHHKIANYVIMKKLELIGRNIFHLWFIEFKRSWRYNLMWLLWQSEDSMLCLPMLYVFTSILRHNWCNMVIGLAKIIH